MSSPRRLSGRRKSGASKSKYIRRTLWGHVVRISQAWGSGPPPTRNTTLVWWAGVTDGAEVRLSIIIGTSGRPTLQAALASATSQMQPGDELIVVFDDSADAGDTPRNRVLDSATGTHILFLDD